MNYLTLLFLFGALLILVGLGAWAATLYASVGLRKTILVLGAAFVVGALALLLIVLQVVGVWLPDVVRAQPRVVTEQVADSGQRYQVVQYLDVDFYTTELRVPQRRRPNPALYYR